MGLRSNLVSFDSGNTFRQRGALGDGKIVHLLVRCSVEGLGIQVKVFTSRAYLLYGIHLCMY